MPLGKNAWFPPLPAAGLVKCFGPFRATLVSSSSEREAREWGLRGWGCLFRYSLPRLWKRGKEICGAPSPSIMVSLLHDKVKGPTDSPLDSHPRVG